MGHARDDGPNHGAPATALGPLPNLIILAPRPLLTVLLVYCFGGGKPVPDQGRTTRQANQGHGRLHQMASKRDMALPPTVIYPLTLPALLRYVLSTQSAAVPTRLVVCSSKEAFLLSLAAALQLQEGRDQPRSWPLQFAAPTLHNLLTARHVQVAFCASVQILLAYFTSLKPPASSENTSSNVTQGPSERFILVNPLSLHAATSAFSAQGLSRTFAAAVETSLRVHAQLVVAECQGACTQPHSPREHEHENEDGYIGNRQPQVQPEDPWEQEVSILNISVKKLGDRPWAGRTIKVKRIAGRWFRFHKLDNPEL